MALVGLLALLAICAFALVSFMVGARLTLLSLRTGRAPERLLGLSLLLAGGLGTAGTIATGFATEWKPVVLAITMVLVHSGITVLGIFTWRVFRPTPLGATLVATCVALLFASLIADRVTGHYVDVGRSTLSLATDYTGRITLYAWACFESLRHWQLARRRTRIGLGDPLTANRFLLWGIAMLAALGIWIHGIWLEIGKVTDTSESYLVIAVLGSACALSIWLAFFPPSFYRTRFAAATA
jgi:hypothetical protein